jgi:hypothetical protein
MEIVVISFTFEMRRDPDGFLKRFSHGQFDLRCGSMRIFE